MSPNTREAEGYLELGMHLEAWEALEELPATERAHPLVIEVRLRILTAMGKWALGQELARFLLSSAIEPAKCLETAARFHHAHARHLSQSGQHEASRAAVRAAVAAWPEIRLAIVEDEGVDLGR